MVSRKAILAHCRALTAACNYSEGDVMVCVVDCRREAGLWHAALAVSFIYPFLMFPRLICILSPFLLFFRAFSTECMLFSFPSMFFRWIRVHGFVWLQNIEVMLVLLRTHTLKISTFSSFLRISFITFLHSFCSDCQKSGPSLGLTGRTRAPLLQSLVSSCSSRHRWPQPL